jgi:hypothetical protein
MSVTEKRLKPEVEAPRDSARDASSHSPILVWNGLVARAPAREPTRSERESRDRAEAKVGAG